MSTRAEKERADEQRHGETPAARKRAKARRTRAEKFGAAHPTARAGKKASYALERPSREGRASRKSTRAAANRMKADTNLNLREERQKGSPESRFRRSRVKAQRVKGRPSAP